MDTNQATSSIKNIIFDIGGVLIEFKISMYIERAMLPIEANVRLVEKLSKQYRLFAITDASQAQIHYSIQNFPFFSLFQDILIASEVGLRKNNAALYQHFVEQQQLIPDECLYIDDREENVQAAQVIGMFGIVFRNMDDCVKKLSRLGVVL